MAEADREERRLMNMIKTKTRRHQFNQAVFTSTQVCRNRRVKPVRDCDANTARFSAKCDQSAGTVTFFGECGYLDW